jgi:hypothetical protein
VADLKLGPLPKQSVPNINGITPVEKCSIVPDGAPFMAVELHVGETDAGRELRFRINVGEWVTCGPDHPLWFETEAATGGLKPYVYVRADLWAKATRAVWLELAELGEVREIAGTQVFGVVSAGEFYAMAPASSLPSLPAVVYVDAQQSTCAPDIPVYDNRREGILVPDAQQ